MSIRPSFILFMTDQQQAGMLGCAGNPVVKTPNIDAIAAAGTRFDRFYVAMPSCMPNRASILTSLYPSVHGVRFNGIPLPEDSVTFPKLFKAAGYRTGLVGKCHLQPFLEPFPDRHIDDCPWWRKELDCQGSALLPPYYGFENVSIVTGHGDCCGGHYETWLKERLPDYPEYVGSENQLPHDYSCPQAVRTRLPEELYSTSYIAECAIDFLEEQVRSDEDRPFVLVVSFSDPHHPFNPPGRYWNMYDPGDVVLPENFASSEAPAHLAAAREARLAGADCREGYGPVALDEREARQAIALTYGMITMIDDAIGRIRTRLVELGLSGETVQVFTSDHGDLLGDHGLMLKGPLHYQSLILVPFLLDDPMRGTGKTVDTALFSGVDIGVSLLDRAGIEAPPGFHGMSLFEVLEGRRAGRQRLLIEDEYQSPLLGFEKPPRLRTVVSEGWRMTMYLDESWGELYDLVNDPGETKNLWNDRSASRVKSELTENLVSLMIEAIDRRREAKSFA